MRLGLFARRCSLILAVPLAFNFRPEPGAGFGSQAVQIIFQFLGVCGAFLALELFRCFLPLMVEGEHH